MVTIVAIHRIIENQAATRGESLAYVDDRRAMTYRELNYRANAVARALMANGFRRGCIAAVRMERSAELLVTLLAVLKAGGAYMWIDTAAGSWPHGVSIVQRGAGGEDRCQALDLSPALAGGVQPSANLPVLTRGSDVACVLRDGSGAPGVLVPHSTVVALLQQQPGAAVDWSGDNSAIDVWVALMTGATVAATAAPASAAA